MNEVHLLPDGRYSVNGVLSLKRRTNPHVVLRSFFGRVTVSERCWEWTGVKDRGGYGNMRAFDVFWLAHRFSWWVFEGHPLDMCVLHRCDNRGCVRPDHLFLGTNGDNHADMVTKGRRHSFQGVANGGSVLTDEKVLELRRRYSEGETQTALAGELGITQAAVSLAILGTNWSHLPGAQPRQRGRRGRPR